MSDSVRYIFKTLIKVPKIVFICFAIFNAFAFGVSYMKVLGLSYVAMQVAMENNYIPPAEYQILKDYMEQNLETEILQDVDFTPGTEFTRKQYGEPVTVGVQARYRFIWPLTPREQIHGEFLGMKDSGFGGYKSEAELEATRQKRESQAKSNIVIEYVVPGLRYYPDLQ